MAASPAAGIEPFRNLLVHGLEGIESLADYERRGGYRALRRVLELDDPPGVLRQLESAGLRGRGGAAFPTHRKWAMVREASSPTRYVICNGGEHEPGSLKDRALMEHYPHPVLEGLLIAAHTVGADRAYVYFTEDQSGPLRSVRNAIGELCDRRILRSRRSGFRCEPVCVTGPATYVSGEETAVIGAIEGSDAKPRQKPPFPSAAGLFGEPTLVNNPETLAHVPSILDLGPDRYRRAGTPGSPGTVLITLSNGVNHPGVHEIPYGTTLRTIIEQCGRGTIGGRAVKAVLPGGPSLAFIAGDLLDLPFDHESLTRAGSGVGCGAIRVWLEDECMVEPILEIAEFFAREQCGQCPACRMETNTLVMALKQIVAGSATSNQFRQMEKVTAFARSKGGLCSLIAMAAAPAMSGLRLFQEDFRHHVDHGGCGRARAS